MADGTPLARTEMVHLLGKLNVDDTREGENPNVGSLTKRPVRETRSIAFEILSWNRCTSPWLSIEADQGSVGRGPVDHRLNVVTGFHIDGLSVVFRTRKTNAIGRRWQLQMLSN